MTSPADPQLDLLGPAELREGARPSRPRLGLLLDQRAWLTFLSAEWLVPEHGHQVVLGVNRVFSDVADDAASPVTVWFDAAKLPPINLLAHAAGGWLSSTLQEPGQTWHAVAWNGPLPLFAVESFSVRSVDDRAHVIAMAQGFSDVELPSVPFEVERVEIAPHPGERPALTGAMHPPGNWNSIRGAAAMAAWAVPAIDPWLNLLCESLQDGEPNDSATLLHATWWKFALWSCTEGASSGDPLWTAVVSELATVHSLRELRPRAFLEGVCERAVTFGCDPVRVERLKTQTFRLLNDQSTIADAGLIEDTLSLALQLFLLRPSPEAFIGWRDDWAAMPPGAWWTGATLSGYACGFRALPLHFRGSPEARRILALRTWKLACSGDKLPWESLVEEKLDWTREADFMLLRSDKKIWAEHKISRRGRWYQLDFSDKDIRAKADELVRASCPEVLTWRLVLEDAQLELFGAGTLRADNKKKLLVAKGRVEVALSSGEEIQRQFSETKFRDWLATASISAPLPPPVFTPRTPAIASESVPSPGLAAVPVARQGRAKSGSSKSEKAKPVRTTGAAPAALESTPPPGLSMKPDFISPEQEAELLATIDAHPWDERMARHVQHYGWQYDYKARKVDPSAYLGPLPVWLETLGQRLFDQGVFSELPDQVIVNNYVGAQSISKHIDCIPCFRGPVVTISLNESWDMFFYRASVKGQAERKFKQQLLRRSAVVIDGEARSLWAHEIPKRLMEGKVPRGRRVSITFRKVNV